MAPATVPCALKTVSKAPSTAPLDPPSIPPQAVPSSLQIALAVAVLKSKPDDVSIRDFILGLRQHLRRGKQPVLNAVQHQHLDGAGYWRDQFERAERVRLELQAKVSHLERGKDDLERLLADARSSGPATTSSKRKRDAAKPSSTSKPVKRPKVSDDSTVLGEATNDPFSEDYDVLSHVGEVGTTLANSLYSVHKLYKQSWQSSADSQALCFNLVQTARSLGSVIFSLCKRQDSAMTSSMPAGKQNQTVESVLLAKEQLDLGSTIRASARVFTSLLVGLARLSEHRQTQLAGIVVYECVKMFRTILDGITESALATAKLNTQVAGAASSSAATGKSRAKAIKYVQDTTSRAIAQFLNAVISYLDVGDILHKQLFEGFMFVLLERIGKRLYVCTFDRERSATIEGDISPPENLGSASAGPGKELEQSALRLEIPNLIAMLEKAISHAPHHMHDHSEAVSKPAKGGSQSSKPNLGPRRPTIGAKVALNRHAKERLQQTLINCMFGGDDKDDFLDCLRMPPRLAALPSHPKVEEKDVAEWFKQEVWRLVGWDILGREVEW